MPRSYLSRILTASVYDVAIESPLEQATLLSDRLPVDVLLKREDLQPVFSFKLRGAYNKMAKLDAKARARGVLAASAGNHAQGVALAAQRLGCPALIVMPVTTPELKVDAVKRRGAEVVLVGDSYSDAFQHAKVLEAKRKLTFVHPFDDPDVIAGQGTIGMEILRQHPGPLDAIFVPIGGGGLAAGVGAYVKSVRPDVKVIGVQTADSDAMRRSIAKRRLVRLDTVGLFSDGTAVKEVGRETLRLCRQVVDQIVLVDTDQVAAAIKDVFRDTRSILEPAGALAVAAAKEWRPKAQKRGRPRVVAVCSGANMNFDRLRFVSERAELGEAREAVFGVTIPEERGSFRRFCELVGARNVTEFNYRIADETVAHIFVGIETRSRDEAREIASTFTKAGFRAIDLTKDELAKLHVRHMVGGRSALARDESIYRFVFPEKPGALMLFLTSMSPNWNISLFHYRNQGADYGRILVGIQVPRGEKAQFARFLSTLGYPHVDESENPAYRLFLGLRSSSSSGGVGSSSTRSISNTRCALGGMRGGAPRAP